MDEEVRKEKELAGWEKEKAGREERDRERTRKNREKREKLKMKKGKKKGGDSEDVSGGGKGGGVKARIDLGNQGTDEQMEHGAAPQAEEVQGVIIHDDD